MSETDAERAQRVFDAIQADDTPATITMSMGDVFSAVMALQMVARNWDKLDEPEAFKEYLTWMARRLQEGIVQHHPDAHLYLEAGWYPKEDQE